MYRHGDTFYTCRDQAGRFEIKLGGTLLEFVDVFKYLGVNFHKSGEFTPAVDRVVGVGMGRMWAVLSKIRSLCALPMSFALMLFQAIVQGAQNYASEIWLPLAQPSGGWPQAVRLLRTACSV